MAAFTAGTRVPPAGASHPSFSTGDVFVGDKSVDGGNQGSLKWFHPDGTLRRKMQVDDPADGAEGRWGLAFDASGNLYGPSGYKVHRFKPDGSYDRVFAASGLHSPTTMVFDRQGNLLVGQRGVRAGFPPTDYSDDIVKFNPQGQEIDRFDADGAVEGTDGKYYGTMNIDLAPDQCTIYYAGFSTAIKRYDLCARQQLPDFFTQFHWHHGFGQMRVRAHPRTGRWEVFVGDTFHIHRIDDTGKVVKTYDAGPPDAFPLCKPNPQPPPPGCKYQQQTPPYQDWWAGLALDPDGQSFWATNDQYGDVYKFTIDGDGTGVFQFDQPDSADGAWAIALAGEIRAGEAPRLSVSDERVVEGDSGTTTMAFKVTLSAAVGTNVTVDYFTQDGAGDNGARSGPDFAGVEASRPRRVTIPAGRLEASAPVEVMGDTDIEPDEVFSVNLTNATGATINRHRGTGTIVNDDARAGGPEGPGAQAPPGVAPGGGGGGPAPANSPGSQTNPANVANPAKALQGNPTLQGTVEGIPTPVAQPVAPVVVQPTPAAQAAPVSQVAPQANQALQAQAAGMVEREHERQVQVESASHSPGGVLSASSRRSRAPAVPVALALGLVGSLAAGVVALRGNGTAAGARAGARAVPARRVGRRQRPRHHREWAPAGR